MCYSYDYFTEDSVSFIASWTHQNINYGPAKDKKSFLINWAKGYQIVYVNKTTW